MYTQCPHCQTCFRIAEAHLKVARGKVRCGSCQEIFDATGHLYARLPATPENMLPPADEIRITPQDLSRLDHEHIDLSSPAAHDPAPAAKQKPDQSHFMESTVGESPRYNNLDNIKPISIPGSLDFSDSILQSPEETRPAAADNAKPKNSYEDVEAKELPASSMEIDAIRDLYTTADELLHHDPDSDNDDDLDKHIDELLAFTRTLDKSRDQSRSAAAKHEEDSEFDDLDDIDEMVADKNGPGKSQDLNIEESAPEPAKAKPLRDHSIDFDAIDLSIEPLTGQQNAFTDSVIGIKDPEPHLAFGQNTSPAPARTGKDSDHKQSVQTTKAAHKDDASDDIDDLLEEMGLTDESQDMPRALRRSIQGQEDSSRPLLHTVGLSIFICILVGTLLVQLVMFRSVNLVRTSPGLAPVLTRLCNILPCRYSGPVDVGQISLTSRDVRSHPSQKNTLLISAAFVNQAQFDQPYPDILVTLSDLSGHIVANRRFTPPEYLDRIYNRFLLMESGTPVHITLPVLDPGDDAVNFEFTFL